MENRARVVLIVSLTLALAGCFEHTVSGSYVAKGPSDAELLQLTQTSDGKIVGSLQHVGLKAGGVIDAATVNVIGAVADNNLTLTIFPVGQTTGQNVSGSLIDSGLELNGVTSTGMTTLDRFERGNVADFNTEVERLQKASQSIKFQKVRADQVEVLNRSALDLEKSLDVFVARAKKQIGEEPRVVSYFTRASKAVNERMQRAQRMSSGGDSDARGLQVDVALTQIIASESPIRNASDSIDQAIREMIQEEASLNVRMKAFDGNCLGNTTVKPGDVIPDMGPCRGLDSSVARFTEVKEAVHASHDRVQRQKAEQMRTLEALWQAANSKH
ncbi:hypothetical protein HX866_27255 [Pseudomonas gingeri]|uniref:hypothetical protein n=1 Tax=Pseudomonas gingeri TaxID=117681 RepID=UPI0015A4BF1E|nr:hypothetical protein [Pseudomonas gingeri]NWA28592.1 hypothetical protein [Pseudomonas gingeri]